MIGDAILPYFSQYKDPTSALYQKAFLPQYPGDFLIDVATGKLPSVSWILPPAGYDEHPASPPALGEWFTAQLLKALGVQSRGVVQDRPFPHVTENDGFFDACATSAPSTERPASSSSRQLSFHRMPKASGGPIGMGFRVPMLVISPVQPGWLRSVGRLRPHLATAAS